MWAGPSGRRRLIAGLAAAPVIASVMAAAAAVSGCNALPSSIVLPLSRLQAQIDTRFPRSYPLAGLIELNLSTPALQLHPERNRLQLQIAVQAGGPALRRSYDGRLDLEFGLHYDATDQTVRAQDLQVLALQIDGLPRQTAQWLAAFGPRLAEQALRDGVLYQLQAKDLARAGRLGVRPGRITVTSEGLEIELIRP